MLRSQQSVVKNSSEKGERMHGSLSPLRTVSCRLWCLSTVLLQSSLQQNTRLPHPPPPTCHCWDRSGQQHDTFKTSSGRNQWTTFEDALSQRNALRSPSTRSKVAACVRCLSRAAPRKYAGKLDCRSSRQQDKNGREVFRLHAAEARQKATSGCRKPSARKRHLAVLALSVTVVFLLELARDECLVHSGNIAFHCFYMYRCINTNL